MLCWRQRGWILLIISITFTETSTMFLVSCLVPQKRTNWTCRLLGQLDHELAQVYGGKLSLDSLARKVSAWTCALFCWKGQWVHSMVQAEKKKNIFSLNNFEVNLNHSKPQKNTHFGGKNLWNYDDDGSYKMHFKHKDKSYITFSPCQKTRLFHPSIYKVHLRTN